MCCCGWKDNQVAHPLVVCIEREVRLQHLIGAQVVPVEMRRDTAGRDEGIVLFLRVKVGTYTNDGAVWLALVGGITGRQFEITHHQIRPGDLMQRYSRSIGGNLSYSLHSRHRPS